MSAGSLAVALVAQTVRMGVPYACAGLGGLWSERSGVVNIALEGILLAGALGSVVADAATGNPLAGVAAGAVVGAAFAAMHALVVVRGRVDAIVSGLALNLVAAGGTRFVLRALYESSSNSPAIAGFAGVLHGAGNGALFFRTLFDPLTIATAFLVVATAYVLARTRFGLRVRACGEDPVAAQNVGIDVARVRLLAVSCGGAICGLGGVALAYDQHRFDSAMSGGRGFIALALLILAGWRPGRLAAACLAFAFLDTLQIGAQDAARGASYAAQMLPCVATLGVLWLTARRRRGSGRSAGLPPAGLGRAAD